MMVTKNLVLKVSLALSFCFIIVGILFTDWLRVAADGLLNILITYFNWFYLLAGIIFLFLCLYMMFSKYGNIKLGNDSDTPEFSKSSWLSMLFASGMGVGLVFWSVAEPVSHYINPPYGEAESAEAANLSMQYVFFHWFFPWAIFGVMGLGLAYFQFRKRLPAAISSLFYPLLKERIYSGEGKTIDIFAIFITSIGLASTLGLSALQISGGLSFVWDLPNSVWIQIGIIVLATLLFLISALSGLGRGIKYLSNLNMILAGLAMLIVFSLGPSNILQVLVGSTGRFFNNIIEMSLGAEPFLNERSDWTNEWTVFYWAWWMTWAPFVGAFFARISKGRSIKEYIMGVLIVPTLISFVWFSVFGGSALNLLLNQGANSLIESTQADETYALFAFLELIPFGSFLTILVFALILFFFVTSADSGSYVLAMFSDSGNLTPPSRLKVIWGIMIAGSAIVFLLAGGLEAVQTISIVVASPFAILMLFICYSIVRSVKDEFGETPAQKKSIRKLSKKSNEKTFR
ncbi:BCCT family transporter [Salicibibacter cibarius]|uniref:BCCT family transporter n=1 Tax=Salicibibacter cibarius TaxID=2743000 RepID=A0A7T6Z1B6_9BACI|nr:BCCT family transporter [Salicibibacter cibarius]QQK74978.1 BCCT family transporter [Salicibibacter cibarius]